MTPSLTAERPSAARIEPRIDQRRAAVTRRRGRRRLRLILGVVAVVVLMALGWLVLHSSLLAARHVRVVGAVHTTPAAVVTAAGLGDRPPLIDVNPAAAAAAAERLAWVAKATVTRQWPDGVLVRVTERVPVAVVAGPGGSWAELDRTGRVLAEGPAGADAPPAGLISVSLPGAAVPGPAGTTLPGADLPAVAVAGSLPPAFAGQVAAVTLTATGEVDLTLSSSLSVDLGGPSQLAAKYEDVAAMLAHATFHPGDILDVSVPDSPTIAGP